MVSHVARMIKGTSSYQLLDIGPDEELRQGLSRLIEHYRNEWQYQDDRSAQFLVGLHDKQGLDACVDFLLRLPRADFTLTGVESALLSSVEKKSVHGGPTPIGVASDAYWDDKRATLSRRSILGGAAVTASAAFAGTALVKGVTNAPEITSGDIEYLLQEMKQNPEWQEAAEKALIAGAVTGTVAFTVNMILDHISLTKALSADMLDKDASLLSRMVGSALQAAQPKQSAGASVV
jgi:hypothetical protein